ncbi:carbon-nitrogen hydrolase family protein [Shimia aestuarii]|uniref:carbon-nitrogen hydrolase family protein n=1 Tax=Shimia aestuarii TaxID=254406 RepID=UPI001FB51238|nr:carbon-nitrogen hydrolase family protein [Shimia aestuarii]
MKIATAGYPLDFLESWAQYEDKQAAWVAEAAGEGAELLVFPEYGAMELATLAGAAVAADLEAASKAVSERMGAATELHQKLAAEHGVYILGGSGPVFDGGVRPDDRPVNRAHFISPNGAVGYQDKQIMTLYERDPWDVVGCGPLKIFETALGKIGVLICYDSEFPLLGRALADCDVILVPSCTEALAGYWRVRIGAMARALEQQCVTAMASVVGPAGWCDAVDMNTGAGGVFGPPDKGFPATGVIAEGVLNVPAWTYGEADLSAVAEVRRAGGVRNRTHWAEQGARDGEVTYIPLP